MYQDSTKNIITIINFFVKNLKYFFIFFIFSSVVLVAIYYSLDRKLLRSYSWSVHIDLNTEFFLRELQRSMSIDINIANEKLLKSLDLNTHYIDSAGYLYQPEKTQNSFSSNILEQINRDNKTYPVVLVKEQIKNKFNYMYFNFLIQKFVKNNNLSNTSNVSTRYKFNEMDNRFMYEISIDNTDIDLSNYSNALEEDIKKEIEIIVGNYINTFANFILESKNETVARYLDSKKDWLIYYETLLMQKINFLKNQKKIASGINQDNLDKITNSYHTENFSRHYYLTEPIEIELRNLISILESKEYETYIPHFQISEVYLKNLENFENNINEKILEFTSLYQKYINIDLYGADSEISTSRDNIYILIFLFFLINLIFILFMLLRGFYMDNKKAIND